MIMRSKELEELLGLVLNRGSKCYDIRGVYQVAVLHTDLFIS